MGRGSHPAARKDRAQEKYPYDMGRVEALPLPPPSHPKGEPEVMEEMLKLLHTPFAFPPAALKSAKSLRDYAEAALTTTAFIEHTSSTLEDDPVPVSTAYTPVPGLPEPSARPSPMCHISSLGINPGSHGLSDDGYAPAPSPD